MAITAVMTLSGETPVRRGLDADVALAAGGDTSAFERLYQAFHRYWNLHTLDHFYTTNF